MDVSSIDQIPIGINLVLLRSCHGLGQIHHLAWDGWLGIVFLGVFCSGLAYVFWYDALQTLPIAQTGVFLYIEPIVTVVAAAVILKEQLFIATLFGGATILGGVWLVNRRKPIPPTG